MGRTVISFTIKYVQSEKEKLKSEVSKVLDSKNKKAIQQGKDQPMGVPEQPMQYQQ